MLKKTRARRLLGGTVTALATTAFVAGLALSSASAAEKVRWKVPVGFPTTLPALGDTAPWVAEKLKVASGGNVLFKIFEPGKLVPAFQIMEAVKNKKVPAGYTWIGYDMGKIPALPLLAAVPFGMEPWEFMAWWYYGEGQKLANELYAPHNVHPILCGLIGPETAGWFKKPIKSLDDIKGLKIRFAGLGGKVMQEAGASVTVLPGAEIYQALEKGAIDATEFSLPEIDQKLGFYQIVKNNYFPGWHQTFTSLHLIVNKEIWDGLSDENKTLINLACEAGVTNSLAKAEADQGPVIAKFKEEGVTPRKLPLPVLKELYKITQKVLSEEAAKDAWFKKIWDSQKKFAKTYNLWKSFGYLPRDFEEQVQQ